MSIRVDGASPGKFDISAIKGGFRVNFYCSEGDQNITSDIFDSDYEEAVRLAWQESRKYFNRCHQCGAWVCDEHYNENVMKCVLCQPK